MRLTFYIIYLAIVALRGSCASDNRCKQQIQTPPQVGGKANKKQHELFCKGFLNSIENKSIVFIYSRLFVHPPATLAYLSWSHDERFQLNYVVCLLSLRSSLEHIVKGRLKKYVYKFDVLSSDMDSKQDYPGNLLRIRLCPKEKKEGYYGLYYIRARTRTSK